MIKVLIIDDEPLAASLVREYLLPYKDVEVVEECINGFEGIKAINRHQPELIFLDVQMPKITGFEMLELIDNPPDVIFTTAFDEYAIKAFDAHAIDYLLKPFSKERFDKAMQKWSDQKKGAGQPRASLLLENTALEISEKLRVVVKAGNDIKIIPTHEIQYFEAYDDYVKIHIENKYFLKKKTMAYYEKILDPVEFVRVHRSFIIQIKQINKIELMGKDTHTAILKSGTQIPLSKSGYSRLKEVLGM